MSKERLEEIQKDVNYAYRRDGSINTKAITMHIEHYEHLYEQAERVPVLEFYKQDWMLVTEQNKRYRESMKKLKQMVNDSEVDCGMICDEIREMALESESE